MRLIKQLYYFLTYIWRPVTDDIAGEKVTIRVDTRMAWTLAKIHAQQGVRMSLSNDVCRCHEEMCVDKENCLRWIERTTGDSQTPRGYLYSEREDPIKGNKSLPCKNKIEKE